MYQEFNLNYTFTYREISFINTHEIPSPDSSSILLFRFSRIKDSAYSRNSSSKIKNSKTSIRK